MGTIVDKYRAFALRDINAGDELVCDYKLLYAEAEQKIRCNCQAPNCLGEIYGFNDLSAETKQALLPLWL